MRIPSIWSLIAINTGRQYGGNAGYEDEVSQYYRYDSRVPNHKQLAVGDVVFLRDRYTLLGGGFIESVSRSPGTKQELRCPGCGDVNLRRRTTRTPVWRCSKCALEFDAPIENQISVETYVARYDQSYCAAPTGIPAKVLKAAAVTPNDQLSIERLDLNLAREGLLIPFPESSRLFLRAAMATTLDPADASIQEKDVSGFDYFSWEGDERMIALRAIRVRRGQALFRDKLLGIYSAQCVVSRCALVDLLEAAHIAPYRGVLDNNLTNGLLLRSDLHTLFDLGHMAIEPNSLTAVFSSAARLAGYEELHGTKLVLGEGAKPSAEALSIRWIAFVETHGRHDPAKRILGPLQPIAGNMPHGF